MKQHENNNKNRLFQTKKMEAGLIEKFLKSLIVFLGTLFLFYNLITSQTISPIYYHLVTNDERSVVDFLEKIKFFPEYKNILKMNSVIYGSSITDNIFAKENQKKQLINNLEQLLVYNPKERDLLYSLSQLYLSEGDHDKASIYMKLAKIVDPNLE